MNNWKRILTVCFGALLAATTYFRLAMGNAQMFSHDAFGLAFLIGLASLPAGLIAFNMGQMSKWTVAGGLALSILMFVWLFMTSFAASLPGTEWIDSGMMTSILVLPVISAAVLLIRFRQALPTLAVSILCGILVIAFAAPQLVRRSLDKQIAATLQRGGCAWSGRETKHPVQSAAQVRLGWFVGAHSDQVVFVEGQESFRWSHSRLGLESRRGQPEAFQVPAELACK